MILFLSDFKIVSAPVEVQEQENGKVVNGRTVVGSELKTLSSAFKHKYRLHDGQEDSVESWHTNDAPIRDAVKYLREKGKTLDKIIYFRTDTLLDGPYWIWDGAESHWYETQDALFQVRIRSLCSPDLDSTEFVAVPFDANSRKPMQESINAVVAMEKAITDGIPKWEMANCHLLADVTGGKRTANMAMAAVQQLLQYKRIHVNLVLYSDAQLHLVSDVQLISDLYQLVAGVDAFTKYGRSDSIEDYFDFEYMKNGKENEGQTALEQLLSIMHRFADAMSLCWPDHILKALNDLINALDAYPKENAAPKEKLLIQLLPTIREKYDSLLFKEGPRRGKIDRLAVIEWCIDNKMIQQALTFCTEWLPQYIVEYGALYSDDCVVQKYCKQQGREKTTNGKKYFIKEFSTKTPPKAAILKTFQENSFKMGFRALLEGTACACPTFHPGDLPEFLNSIPQRLQEAKDNPLRLNPTSLQNRQDKAFVEILMDTAQNKGMPFCVETVRKIKAGDIRATLGNYSEIKIREYFSTFSEAYPYKKPSGCDSMDTSKKAAAVFEALLKCGMAKTIFAHQGQDPDFTEAVEYIRQYTYIRANIRNVTNHALTIQESKKDSPQNFMGVMKALEDCLNLMKNLVKDQRAIAHKAKNVWPDTPPQEQTPKKKKKNPSSSGNPPSSNWSRKLWTKRK